MQILAGGIRPALIQLISKTRYPFIGLAIFFIAGEQVPHAADLRRIQFRISNIGMRLKMVTAERLMQVVKEQRAGKNQYVNETVLNHVSQQATHARRYQRSRTGD